MTILENQSLKPYNSFGIDVSSRYLASFKDVEEWMQLVEYCEQQDIPFRVIGGGSNVLFVRDFDGLIAMNKIKGKEVVSESENQVVVRLGAGENWHEMVMWAVSKDWGGIENLSLIPGCVGAAPIQNIGAYGTEIKDVLQSVEVYDLKLREIRAYQTSELELGYRDSLFKRDWFGRMIVLSVTLVLTKNDHQIKTTYGAIEAELAKKQIDKPGIREVADAVISIRQAKLPDPKIIGNAGSFFKNPVVSEKLYNQLKSEDESVPGYKLTEELVKIPAGWLIEKCGFKGKIVGETGCHEKQALVIVNKGNAKGEEIRNFANTIINTVEERFGIRLQPEVNIIE